MREVGEVEGVVASVDLAGCWAIWARVLVLLLEVVGEAIGASEAVVRCFVGLLWVGKDGTGEWLVVGGRDVVGGCTAAR